MHAEVLDLTHGTNVELFRKWDQKEVAYVQMLRFIRISCTNPAVAILSRPGKHPFLLESQSENIDHGTLLNANIMVT